MGTAIQEVRDQRRFFIQKYRAAQKKRFDVEKILMDCHLPAHHPQVTFLVSEISDSTSKMEFFLDVCRNLQTVLDELVQLRSEARHVIKTLLGTSRFLRLPREVCDHILQFVPYYTLLIKA